MKLGPFRSQVFYFHVSNMPRPSDVGLQALRSLLDADTENWVGRLEGAVCCLFRHAPFSGYVHLLPGIPSHDIPRLCPWTYV